MAARTDAVGVKILVGDEVAWRLEFSGTREWVPCSIQKWRVRGEGRTHKEQMREYATQSLRALWECAEGQQTDHPAPVPAGEMILRPSSPIPTAEEVLAEDRGQSSGLTHSVVEEAETMISPAREPSPSSGSEFNNADGYISGKEEIESEKKELEEDDFEVTIKDAHFFQIFQDEEKREPSSILDLDFDSRKGHRPITTLHMVACTSRDSPGKVMRTVDSWKIKSDGDKKLEMYVRDTKGGSWIKLWKHAKEYEVSVRDALIIIKFLELAMVSKETAAKKVLDELVDKIGSRRIEIKKVLLKYYSSVVEKFVQSEKAPAVLRKAPIIRKMEFLLSGKLEKETFETEERVASVKRPSTIDERKLEDGSTPGVQSLGNKRRRIEESGPDIVPKQEVQNEREITAPDAEIVREEDVEKERKKTVMAVLSNKRKRVVESDAEDDSDSEDHVPLAQRQFTLPEKPRTIKSQLTGEQIENTVKKEEPDARCEGRKQGQDSNACAGPPFLPASNKDDGFLRFGEEGVNFEGEQDFQDSAEIYDDGIGEIEDDDDDELGESAFCAICDDGGDLLLCDGPCMRSFHASKESTAQSDSKCRSLGYTVEKVREMGSWSCPNCVHNQHQCFICGLLGKSDGDGKEVFVCDVALCGRFYHPSCLAKWKKNEKFSSITDEDAFVRRVKEGVEEFCCPAHKCRKCGEGEKEGGVDNSMKLAKCRRCPKSYHKLCLPKRISFEGIGDEPVRAWEIGSEDDPMKRLVIYCLDHPIIEHYSTPARTHLKWPKDSSSTHNIGHKDSPRLTWPGRTQQKLIKSTPSRQIDDEITHQKNFKGTKSSSKQKTAHGNLNVGKRNPWGRPNMDSGSSLAARKDVKRFHMPKRESPVPAVTFQTCLPSKHANVPKRTDLQKKHAFIPKISPISREGQEERVSGIIRRASQNVTLETVKATLVQPSCYAENKKKNILQKGELQSLLNAARKAVEKVQNGGSEEDAKRLCPRDKFIQLLKTSDMLKVHLSPILHGNRYSSFGRHFTSPDKLREIVNRIHPYIDSGDMIVDFCCGANDFSVILNEKLLSTGKHCLFKNFDIHPPKNEFCFTKGDWLTNPGHGFLEGKKLIMGLNPPFGVRAQLANRFILQALKFRPKLLVLIVPPEAMSYSTQFKAHDYDLVWEDNKLLEGHAFYLPGAVNEKDNETVTQWNRITPPLYLWSTREMVQNHREIALRCGHVKPDTLLLHTGRPSTQTPPPTDQSRGMGTNSLSTPTEYDTSSSRLQHSSTTSSQNSLEGSGLGGHHASGQNPSQRGPTAGEQASDPAARHLMHLKRTESLRQGLAIHIPSPVAGPAHNNYPPVLSHQHRNHANQSSPRGNPGPWMSTGFQNPQPLLQNPPAGQQLWPVLSSQVPNFPIDHGFPHQRWGPSPSWQPPLQARWGFVPNNSIHGLTGHPQGEVLPPPPPLPLPPPLPDYMRGHPPQPQRRPGGNQRSAENGSGGWLD